VRSTVLGLDRHAVGVEAGEVEQLLEHGSQMSPPLLDALDPGHLLLVERAADGENVGIAMCAERGAELVRQRRRNLPFARSPFRRRSSIRRRLLLEAMLDRKSKKVSTAPSGCPSWERYALMRTMNHSPPLLRTSRSVRSSDASTA
jgi:hypothetical protein